MNGTTRRSHESLLPGILSVVSSFISSTHSTDIIQGLARTRAWASQPYTTARSKDAGDTASPSKHVFLPPGKCKACSSSHSLQSEGPQCVFTSVQRAKEIGQYTSPPDSWESFTFSLVPREKSVSIRWFSVSLRSEGVLWMCLFLWSCSDRELRKCLTKI